MRKKVRKPCTMRPEQPQHWRKRLRLQTVSRKYGRKRRTLNRQTGGASVHLKDVKDKQLYVGLKNFVRLRPVSHRKSTCRMHAFAKFRQACSHCHLKARHTMTIMKYDDVWRMQGSSWIQGSRARVGLTPRSCPYRENFRQLQCRM